MCVPHLGNHHDGNFLTLAIIRFWLMTLWRPQLNDCMKIAGSTVISLAIARKPAPKPIARL